MKRRKYYKAVCRSHDGKYVSIGVPTDNKEACIEYKIGVFCKAHKWLAEKGYHPLCFNTLGNLINAMPKEIGDYVFAFECEIKGETPLPRAAALYHLTPEEFRISIDPSWDKGAIMAKEIKITKPIVTKTKGHKLIEYFKGGQNDST
jgi:hypothetical protein